MLLLQEPSLRIITREKGALCHWTHVHITFRVNDGGKAFCLEAKRVQTLLGQSECWQEMRWGIQKQTELQIKSRPTSVKPRHTVSQARRRKGEREKMKRDDEG